MKKLAFAFLFLSIAAYAISLQSNTIAGLKDGTTSVASWPSGLVEDANGNFYGCTRDKVGDQAQLRIVEWVYGSDSMKMIALYPGATHCQFAKDEAGNIYFATSLLVTPAPRADTLVVSKLDPTTQTFTDLPHYKSTTPFLLFGTGIDKGAFAVSQGNILIPITYADSATATHPGLLRSTDSGATWQSLDLTGADAQLSQVTSVRLGSDGAWLISGRQTLAGGMILSSDDLGKSWQKIYQDQDASLLILKAVSGTRLLALKGAKGISYLVSSTDSGKTWQQAPVSHISPTESSSMWDLAYDPASQTVVMAGAEKVGAQIYSVWASKDLGQTWFSVDNYRGDYTAKPFADTHAVAIDEQGFVYTLGHATTTEESAYLLLRRSVDPLP